MLAWLVGWLVGWLVDWLVGCLAGWLAGWLVGWLSLLDRHPFCFQLLNNSEFYLIWLCVFFGRGVGIKQDNPTNSFAGDLGYPRAARWVKGAEGFRNLLYMG